MRLLGAIAVLLLGLALAAAAAAAPEPRGGGGAQARVALPAPTIAFLDTLERGTFAWFWELSDSSTGLTPDRAPTGSFVSVGAVGFALTAYPIGAERGWVTRAQAAERVLRTLRFFWQARQDSAASGITGYRGFFYHFLDPRTGQRFETVELSTMDTALLTAGALFCQSYFDRSDPREAQVRALAESLYARVDWSWIRTRPPTLSLGWTPERGFLPYDWRGYDEALLLHVLALGSTTHPVGPETWGAFTQGYRWGRFHGFAHVVESSILTTYSSVLASIRVQRSTRCRFSRDPW